ncbi:hypothetical protein FQR65_LT03822 [Abscondita terminalis]|nr:hypothetical protein FQR65_LT03822 [Abscondita terminalis]
MDALAENEELWVLNYEEGSCSGNAEMLVTTVDITTDQTVIDIQGRAQNNTERDRETQDKIEYENFLGDNGYMMTFQKRKTVESVREINKKWKIKGQDYKNYKVRNDTEEEYI